MDDHEAIRQLKARYFRLMDTKEWDAFGELFTEDAVMQTTPDPEERFVGRSEIVAQVSRHLKEAVTVHHGHMPEIHVDGDTATGIWAMEDFVGPAPAGAAGVGALPRGVPAGVGHLADPSHAALAPAARHPAEGPLSRAPPDGRASHIMEPGPRSAGGPARGAPCPT